VVWFVCTAGGWSVPPDGAYLLHCDAGSSKSARMQGLTTADTGSFPCGPNMVLGHPVTLTAKHKQQKNNVNSRAQTAESNDHSSRTCHTDERREPFAC
jgi:hypothetical protein